MPRGSSADGSRVRRWRDHYAELLKPARVAFPMSRFRTWRAAFPEAEGNTKTKNCPPGQPVPPEGCWRARATFTLDLPLGEPQPFDADLEAKRSRILEDLARANVEPANPACDVRLDVQAAHYAMCEDAYARRADLPPTRRGDAAST